MSQHSSDIYLTQPPVGTPVDYGNPIASGLWCQYLFNEMGGKECLDSSGMDSGIASFTGTDPIWTEYGLIVGSGGIGYARNNKTVKSTFNPVRGSHTVRVVHLPIGPYTGGFTALLDVAGTTGSGRILNIFVDTSGNVSYRGIGGADGSATANTIGMVPGRVSDLVWVRSYGDQTAGTTNTHFWYLDGVLAHTEVGLSAVAWPTDGYDMAFGGNPTGSGSLYNGQYLIVQCWDRALSSTEISWLAANPYGLSSPGPIYSFGVAADATATATFEVITLTAPAGSGLGGATASATFEVVTLTAPTATAFDPAATGQGTFDVITLTAPVATASDTAAQATFSVITLTAPVAIAYDPDDTATASFTTVTLFAPTAVPYGPRFGYDFASQLYWGRFSRGQYLNVMCNPDGDLIDVPTVKFWLNGSTLVRTITLPAADRDAEYFGMPLLLDGTFEDGNYIAVLYLSVASYSAASFAYFEVQGGTGVAPVISLTEIDRSFGRAVISHRADGDISMGYNPRRS